MNQLCNQFYNCIMITIPIYNRLVTLTDKHTVLVDLTDIWVYRLHGENLFDVKK